MIISRTPFRMSFVGGGSDIPSYYREDFGAVISTTIDRYMYICVNKKFDGRLRISYSKTEDVDDVNEVAHPLVRETLKMLDIPKGIEIASLADIPSFGSGLGSSSAYTVGLLNALYAFKNESVTKEILASQACDIELNRCKEPIGKQDQYAAAYGGFNLISFLPNDSVIIEPVICNTGLIQEIEESTLFFFTGRTRKASSILANQVSGMKDTTRRALMKRMVQLAFDLKEQFEIGDLTNFGEILDENWRLKKQMSSGISDPYIDNLYDIGMRNGASGGKLLGAGSGGFMMFFAPKKYHSDIISALSSLRLIKFRFEKTGSQIILNKPNI